jgi:hypothetical protein
MTESRVEQIFTPLVYGLRISIVTFHRRQQYGPQFYVFTLCSYIVPEKYGIPMFTATASTLL